MRACAPARRAVRRAECPRSRPRLDRDAWWRAAREGRPDRCVRRWVIDGTYQGKLGRRSAP